MKEKEKISSKRRILDAAEEQFALCGFEGTTTRSISRNSGLNLSLIKYYFGSKNGLYESVIQSRIEDFQSTYTKFLLSKKKPDLNVFLTHYISWFSENGNFFRLVNREFCSPSDNEVKKLVSAAVLNHFLQMKTLIDTTSSSGQVNNTATVFLYLTIFGLLQAYVETSPVYTLASALQTDGKHDLEKIKEYLFALTKHTLIQ
ncbi:TetR/AcrR family transcriptional regulator [Pedobacter sp.]|uniref:TetR/AcrR family transcriptional regulator n=1 Tax=Pedobacter sp. TaxID=1411316 RepID=UPI003C389B36